MKIVNEKGLEELRLWLVEHHWLSGCNAFKPPATYKKLFAWASEIEDNLLEDGIPALELDSWESSSGYNEIFYVSPGGISEEEED